MAKKKTTPKKKPGSKAVQKRTTVASLRKETVASLRKKLDKIDGELLKTINERAEVARQIGEAKREGKQSVYDPKREAEVIGRIVASNAGPLSNHSVQAVFREIVSGSRAVQAPIRVSYLGPEFTFSHLAALEQFGESTELIPVATIGTVFEEVERGQADYGVVPMENSTDGRVTDTLESFARSNLKICGELPLRIHHCLMGIGRQDEVEIVHSKPQALSQCRNWLAKHMPQATIRPVGSSAEAAALARENQKVAAVGSERAAANHDLKVFARNIEDNSENITRFAVISKNPAERTGNDKTALLLEIAHEPGALADTMAIFKRNRLNLTWIESFPIPGSLGKYLFFLEFAGHPKDLRCRKAIASAEKKSLRLVVLGSYAQADPIG